MEASSGGEDKNWSQAHPERKQWQATAERLPRKLHEHAHETARNEDQLKRDITFTSVEKADDSSCEWPFIFSGEKNGKIVNMDDMSSAFFAKGL